MSTRIWTFRRPSRPAARGAAPGRGLDEALRRQPGQQLDWDSVLEVVVLHMPQENYERVFETLIGWARAGDLFGYDETTQTLTLD